MESANKLQAVLDDLDAQILEAQPQPSQYAPFGPEDEYEVDSKESPEIIYLQAQLRDLHERIRSTLEYNIATFDNVRPTRVFIELCFRSSEFGKKSLQMWRN